jgi:hypothetical protein
MYLNSVTSRETKSLLFRKYVPLLWYSGGVGVSRWDKGKNAENEKIIEKCRKNKSICNIQRGVDSV